jgi:Mn2+/Fe2+ NRAMP family transporter
MGHLRNAHRTNWLAYITTSVILALNALLLFQALGGKF